MAEISIHQRRRMLRYADELAALEPPSEFARFAVNRAINAIRRRYGLSDDQKHTEAHNAILQGFATIADIQRATGIGSDDVRRAVKALIEAGRVEQEQLRYSGGLGRPALLLMPVGNTAKK